MKKLKGGVAALGLLLLLVPQARAQVAFFPTPGVIPDGAALSVTPAVSADRRYVRLSLDASFVGFVSFTSFPVPAAVGGGGGGGLGAALGGAGRGLAGGGLGGAAGAGGQFMVGMNGLEGQAPAFDAYGPAYFGGFNPMEVQSSDPFQVALHNPPMPSPAPQAERPAHGLVKAKSARQSKPAVTKRRPSKATSNSKARGQR